MGNERILAQGCTVSNDTRATGLNNNDIIIGPSGAGKTRGYVIPNILQGNESMIIADTKGDLRRRLGSILERQGYQVMEVDFKECMASPLGYNPLEHIRYDRKSGKFNEQDIMSVSACLIPLDRRDPFWSYYPRMFLDSMIAYVLEFLPPAEHDLVAVNQLFEQMAGENFDRLFRELEQVAPDCFAYRRYQAYRMTKESEKTYASAQAILASNLAACSFDGAAALFRRPNRVRFPSLGVRKTALFLTVSDMDHSLDPLVTLFYTQALQSLCRSADKKPGCCLDVPVRLIMDDFAANVCIPDFDKTISVIRSRGISVSLIIQSLSQLDSLYGNARGKTILNNCDHCLYLGGQDVGTAQYISKKANRPASDILNMPLDDVWLFTRGETPRRVTKYHLEDHPLYPKQKEEAA